MRWMFVLILLPVLIFSIAGCSENGEVVEPKDGLVADNFYYIAGPSDLADYFQEIEYSYTSVTPDKTETQDNGYYYLGPDPVDGGQAEKIRLDLSGRYSGDWVFWLDSEGAPIKCTENGNEVVDDLELVTAGLAYGSFTAPFVIVTTHFQLPLVSDMHLEHYGWNLVNEATISRNLGAGSVDVSIYEFEKDDGDTFYFEIAKIKEKNMYINFQISQTGKPSHDFKVTRLIPR